MSARDVIGTDRRSDAGLSLVELLVAGLVASIVLGALGTVFAGSLTASSRATVNVSATAEARRALDTVTRRLRVAVRPAAGAAIFSEATASSMTFTASISLAGATADPAPSTVRYVVDTGRRCLLETITPSVGAVRTTCLGFGDLTPTFRYFQVAKRPTLDRPTPSPVPTAALALGTTGLSPTDAGVVGAVEVSLSARDLTAPSTVKPVVVSTRVLLDNDLNEVPL